MNKSFDFDINTEYVVYEIKEINESEAAEIKALYNSKNTDGFTDKINSFENTVVVEGITYIEEEFEKNIKVENKFIVEANKIYLIFETVYSDAIIEFAISRNSGNYDDIYFTVDQFDYVLDKDIHKQDLMTKIMGEDDCLYDIKEVIGDDLKQQADPKFTITLFETDSDRNMKASNFLASSQKLFEF